MKHAFLITAYRDWESLRGLIDQLLKIEESKIYINIDKRSFDLIQNVEMLINKNHFSRIYLQKDEKIHWGGFNHLMAFIRLMSVAINDKCEYFHTMTGQCRITKSPTDFLEFFEKNRTKSYIENNALPYKFWAGNGGLDRIKFYQLYDLIDAKKSPKLFRRLNKHFIHLQKFLKINRLNNIVYYGGSTYFSLSKEACLFLFEEFQLRKEEFKYSFCPEEIAPQTILLNAPATIKLNITNNNLRYVLWAEKNGEIPGILDDEDLSQIKNNGYFFARKFDSTISKNLIKHLT
jgi:hypothetical protein